MRSTPRIPSPFSSFCFKLLLLCVRAPFFLFPPKRWSAELANRRQYLAYLVALSEDVQSTRRRVLELQRAYQTCLAELQGMVGEKASVPKEHVYPKFEATAVRIGYEFIQGHKQQR
jgi:hypothetical protein